MNNMLIPMILCLIGMLLCFINMILIRIAEALENK